MPKKCDNPECEHDLDPAKGRVTVGAQFTDDPTGTLNFENVYCSVECAKKGLGGLGSGLPS